MQAPPIGARDSYKSVQGDRTTYKKRRDYQMDVLQHAAALGVDVGALMKIIVRLSDVHDVHDCDTFCALLNSDVKAVLRHDAMICGKGFASADGSYMHHMLQHNYPSEYFDALATPDGKADSPLIRRWNATKEPVMFQLGRDDDKYPGKWVSVFKKHGFRNTVAHGVFDVHSAFVTYFIFSNIAGEVGEREIFLMKLLIPHLHFALMRVMALQQEYGHPAGLSQDPISEQQKEILYWMYQGKTNWEIAQILSMTENNVKYGIELILAKLGVRNRTQAVFKALLLGLLNTASPKNPHST